MLAEASRKWFEAIELRSCLAGVAIYIARATSPNMSPSKQSTQHMAGRHALTITTKHRIK